MISSQELDPSTRSNVKLPLQILLIAAAVTVVARLLYFLIAPWVISLNRHVPTGTLTPSIESWNAERDGIELYVLYVAMFLIVAAVIGIAHYLPAAKKRLFLAGSAVVVALAVFSPGFVAITPTAPSLLSMPVRLLLALGIAVALGIYLLWQQRIPSAVEWLGVAVLCAFACFVGAEQTDISNGVYMFGPAMRLVRGLDIRETYMQYDLFNTLVAAGWLKLGLGIEYFPRLVQATYFIALMALYFVARRVFRSAALPLLMLLALVLVRILGAPWEPWLYPQTGPLRVDMWIVPLVIIVLRGPFSLLVPIVCGLLILTHGPFGILWTLAWLQLVAILALLSMLDDGFAAVRSRLTASWYMRWGAVAVYLVACLGFYSWFFDRNLEATSLYQSLGIGFLPIKMSSFFWLFPPAFASLATLLILMRRQLPPRYLASAFAVLLFTIAICVYFFGRSHELALNSITVALVTTTFFLLDAIDRWLAGTSLRGSNSLPRRVVPAMALGLVATITFVNIDRLSLTVPARISNLQMLHFPLDEAPPREEARQLMTELDKVLQGAPFEFLTMDRFMEYAMNELAPVTSGFFYPSRAIVYEAELVSYAQGALDASRPLVIDADFAAHVLPQLKYSGAPQELELPDYLSLDRATPRFFIVRP